jgi:hypothetical protein
MLLTSGIPRIAWVDELQRQDLYRRHTDFNRDFLSAHGQALAKYGRHWGQDPFKLWSRRWEYPYVAQRILEFAESQPNDARMRVIDAGSGVTYFPYFICDKVPNAEVTCVDSDPSYPPMFDAINRNVGHRRVSFMEAMLQKLPLLSTIAAKKKAAAAKARAAATRPVKKKPTSAQIRRWKASTRPAKKPRKVPTSGQIRHWKATTRAAARAAAQRAATQPASPRPATFPTTQPSAP